MTLKQKILFQKKFRFIYIDGSHEYEIKKDINNCLPFLKKGGLLILDDSSLYEDFNLSVGNKNIFKGHPGPSKAMQELKNSSEVSFYLELGIIIFLSKNSFFWNCFICNILLIKIMELDCK